MVDAKSTAGTGTLDIHQIIGMIMHRYPLLLVDRVTDCVPGDHIVGLKNVSRSDASFGHAGRSASMPRLLLIEALAQVSVILTFIENYVTA